MPDGTPRRDRTTPALCCAVVTAAFVASGIAAAIHGWRPSWDTAFIQLRVLDVGTGRTPLIGMPSTVSQTLAQPAHHPGPLHVWLLAVPNLLTRFTPAGLAIAQALVNAAVAALSIVAVHAVATRQWTIAATGCWLVAAVAMGDEMLHDPWNPHAATVALLAAALCAAAVVSDSTKVASDPTFTPSPLALIALVVTASLAAQAHLAALIPAAVLVVAALAIVAARIRRCHGGHGWQRGRRAVAVVVATFLICWSGPLLDQLLHRPGNLRTLLTGGDSLGTAFGFVTGFDRLAATVVPPGLLRSGLPAVATGAERWLDRLVLIALVAAVAALAHRRRQRQLDNAVNITVLTLMGATWLGQAITPVTFGSVFGRHMWELMWPAAIGLWFAAVVGLVDIARAATTRRAALPPSFGRSQVRAACAGVAAIVLAVLVIRPLIADIGDQRDGRWFQAIATASDRAPHQLRAVSIVTNGIATESELVAGVAADLQRRGTFVRFAGPISEGLLHPRRLVADPTGDVLLITTVDDPRAAGLVPLAVIDSPVSTEVAGPIRLYLLPNAGSTTTP